MLRKISFTLALFFFLSIVVVFADSVKSINDPIKVKDKYFDLKSFAFLVAEKQGWSLIISNDVSVPKKDVEGNTIKEILDNFCKNSEFGWKFVNGCLYIANKRELTSFFIQLPMLEMTLPDGNKEAKYSGSFKSMDFSMLCLFLSNISGTQINVANGFDASIMMRVKSMPWKHVLLAIVHLNRYRINVSDYSMLISPER